MLYGATGTLGRRILAEALDRGHEVTAAARNPDRVQELPGVTPQQGDVLDAESVAGLARGRDALVSAVGPGHGGDPCFLVEAARSLLAAAERTGVRLVVVGGPCSPESAVTATAIPSYPAWVAPSAPGTTPAPRRASRRAHAGRPYEPWTRTIVRRTLGGQPMDRRRTGRLATLGLLLAVGCWLALACQPARLTPREPAVGQALRINVHGGLGSLPLLLMRERRLLERRVPDLRVEWKAIATPGAVDEALAAGVLDIATGTPTALLLARERGLPVRALAGVAELPLGLVSGRPDARTLRDLGAGDRIAVPAVGGHEHMVLRIAALRELGDWRALDDLVVPRAHPEAFGALLARRDVTAHVAISPYLERELEAPGLRRLLDGAEVMGGPAMAVLVYTTPAIRARQSALVEAFLDALREATGLADGNLGGEAARLLAEGDGLRLAPETLARYLAQPGVRFSTRVGDLSRLATFLDHAGQFRHIPTTRQELLFDDVPES